MLLILTISILCIVSFIITPWMTHLFMTNLQLQKEKDIKVKWCAYFYFLKQYKENNWIAYEKFNGSFFDKEICSDEYIYRDTTKNIIHSYLIKINGIYLKLYPISFLIFSIWVKKEWDNLKQ